ncbi:Predicted nucleotide-binding protein containing TIR-like domain-containing protein [Flavobacterium gillisiae]|uniref:Predicted nucleotide-binding protein containing TIR-like domain-containing protein n=1 Tax=Flavobacterium gillisiae TaxID=150146 RepID=A0A1H4G4Z3_9FLAO|nr:nucleotide-binding protein [Flavobacterium gillisiae]SEB04624.1 Predicted nucleotide-binding protein containing TIR-like domain-containing protein [Flavobacterium gillisiae]
MTKTKIELIESLLSEATALTYNDDNLDKVKKRSEMIAKKVFGDKSEYIAKLNKIRFSPSIVWSGMDRSIYNSTFESGKRELINLINVMLEDVNLSNVLDGSQNLETLNSELSENIFIVHGHNEEMKQSSARFLEKIDLKPIILHEQPNKGKTIIEKFNDYSNVSFAIVLLSADDVAFSKNEEVENASFRARQNVIFELGFFIGKIGRECVVVLHEQVDNFEIPSDYQGVLYIPYDNSGNWKLSVAKELKAIGYKIDGNKLLE